MKASGLQRGSAENGLNPSFVFLQKECALKWSGVHAAFTPAEPNSSSIDANRVPLTCESPAPADLPGDVQS